MRSQRCRIVHHYVQTLQEACVSTLKLEGNDEDDGHTYRHLRCMSWENMVSELWTALALFIVEGLGCGGLSGGRAALLIGVHGSARFVWGCVHACKHVQVSRVREDTSRDFRGSSRHVPIAAAAPQTHLYQAQ
jgi:hypothetical protein